MVYVRASASTPPFFAKSDAREETAPRASPPPNAIRFAIPKSASCALPCGCSRMFSGFRSRYTYPSACRCPSASATCVAYTVASTRLGKPWKFIAWNKSPHGAYSSTRNKAQGS